MPEHTLQEQGIIVCGDLDCHFFVLTVRCKGDTGGIATEDLVKSEQIVREVKGGVV